MRSLEAKLTMDTNFVGICLSDTRWLMLLCGKQKEYISPGYIYWLTLVQPVLTNATVLNIFSNASFKEATAPVAAENRIVFAEQK